MVTSENSKRAILFYGGFASRSGGAFMHATALSEELCARGWLVETITLDNLPFLLRYLPHIVAATLNKLKAPLGFFYKGVMTRILYKYLIRRKPNDLLIFEDVYLSWNSKNPSVTLLHAVWSDNLQAYDISTSNINKLKLKEISNIIGINHPVVTVSEPYRDFLQFTHFRGLGVIALDVVELGLDVEQFQSVRPASDGKPIRSLVYCGALEARKNLYFMLDVFERISDEDSNACLTIIGDGPDRYGLEKYAAERSLNVVFRGRLLHQQVLHELIRHEIYIHTAVKESFSFALLEAKLSGLTTCALSSLQVPKEFVDVGFKEFNSVEWSSRILAIAGRPDLTNFPDYSIKRMADRTLSLVSVG